MRDEQERIETIASRLGRTRRDVKVGIGDDAAVLAPSDDAQVLTVDTCVEGVHFRRDLASWQDIGYRSVVIAVSDIAAMGARVRASLVALVLPRDVDDDAWQALVDGLGEAAAETGATVVGGNVSSGGEVSATVTVAGELDRAPLTRRGARPGDGVYVTGHVGSGALGLALLESGLHDADGEAHHFVRCWRRPSPALQLGQRLHGHATAVIDVSDGVVQDLDNLCRASGVGAAIRVEHLPLAPGFERLAREAGADPHRLALAGGDDYQLLFTAPASRTVKELGTRIGDVTEGPAGVRVLGSDGEPIELTHTGYRHFSRG